MNIPDPCLGHNCAYSVPRNLRPSLPLFTCLFHTVAGVKPSAIKTRDCRPWSMGGLLWIFHGGSVDFNASTWLRFLLCPKILFNKVNFLMKESDKSWQFHLQTCINMVIIFILFFFWPFLHCIRWNKHAAGYHDNKNYEICILRWTWLCIWCGCHSMAIVPEVHFCLETNILGTKYVCFHTCWLLIKEIKRGNLVFF